MVTAFGIIGTLLLLIGLVSLASSSPLAQVQASIAILIAAVLLVGAALLETLKEIRKRLELPRGD